MNPMSPRDLGVLLISPSVTGVVGNTLKPTRVVGSGHINEIVKGTHYTLLLID